MIYFLKKNLNKIILVICVTLLPIISFAGDNDTPSNPNLQGKIIDPLGGRYADLPALIKTILEGVLKIGIPIVALAIIYCGFLFVFARGNSEKLTKARNALLYTVIGAAVLLGAWAIAKMIQATVLAL